MLSYRFFHHIFNLVIDLKSQLGFFKDVERQLKQKLGEAEARELLSRAVYLTSIGSNDYSFPFITKSNILQLYSPELYVDMVIGNLTSVIKEIYKKGGRKFGFLSLGPLGCLPVSRALIPENKGFKYSNTKIYNSVTDRMENPLKYGFKEGNVACRGGGPYRGYYSCGGLRIVKEYELCSNVSEYMFFDAAHPTEKANRQSAEIMWNGKHNVVGPYNLKDLFEH
ncbi:GDSL esterase/lipase [Quillaja saponaria]|uniref:GDSL esterase/lipase n=1 Tax=Quillaja saponaria TaxID=32244 RepID=A0AAD7PDD6_QUISA|nr:GDSL esterase/lipase [Quillaja saponaria]